MIRLKTRNFDMYDINIKYDNVLFQLYSLNSRSFVLTGFVIGNVGYSFIYYIVSLNTSSLEGKRHRTST